MAESAEHSYPEPATKQSVPGWYFNCPAPENLAGLIEWLAVRTALYHEFNVGRFSDEFSAAIVREFPTVGPKDKPKELVLLYARGVIHNVRFWSGTQEKIEIER